MSIDFSLIFSVGFVCAAIIKGVSLLYGCIGEMITEKAGNLNLGIPGIMYMGAAGGLVGAYIYETLVGRAGYVESVAILITIVSALLCSLIGGLIYAFLTVTLRANQNVTGLALTTFGTGFANFLGTSIAKLIGKDYASVAKTARLFKKSLFGYEPSRDGTWWDGICEMLLSYGFLAYVAIAIAILVGLYMFRTRFGLNLRAVGENPAAADAAGVSVTRYKYGAILCGSLIAGLGGLCYFVFSVGGSWTEDCLGDLGWLAIALVIFAMWKPFRAIWSSLLFGALSVAYAYITIQGNRTLSSVVQEAIAMLPYVVTLVVLIVASLRKRKENQPPASLGLSYFREER